MYNYIHIYIHTYVCAQMCMFVQNLYRIPQHGAWNKKPAIVSGETGWDWARHQGSIVEKQPVHQEFKPPAGLLRCTIYLATLKK